MKFLFVALLLTVMMAQILADDEWEGYKTKFQKKYKNPEEEERRYKIFLDNKKLVEEHNAKYSRGEVTYSLEINLFADRTSEELKTLHGVRRPSAKKE